MPIPGSMSDLSTNAALNSPLGADPIGTGLDNYLRAIQSVIRTTNAKGDDIASASTTDIGAATGEFVTVTGATTITSFGTIDAGIVRTAHFSGAPLVTHNATSLILPGGVNYQAAAGDVMMLRSLGAGNWRCVGVSKYQQVPQSPPITVDTVDDMKALTGLADGARIKPFCVNHIFDNSNPPEFRYSTSSVTPNNVTTYSQDVGGGSFHAKYDGRINVRWAGAIGDGSTNDQAAFDACMAIIVANGYGDLYIPATASGYLLNGAAAGPDGYANGILIPFDTVNADPTRQISITGEPGARLLCGSGTMALIRNSRNNSRIRNVILDYNSKTDVYLLFTGPEDATQTTTQVSNSFTEIDSVDRIGGPNVSGLVFMPGPNVGGSDSGCFYHNVRDGSSNFVGGGRHVWLRKNVDYGTNPNWPTRTNFYGQRLTRGNVGYHCEEGSEVNLFGCHEESINSGTSPLATPTARYIAAECDNVNFYGGISEACTAATQLFANNVKSYGYVHASGSDASWLTYASSYDDGVNDSRSWTPIVVSSGGGAEGASTSTGMATKQGKLVHFTCQISVAKGTLAAGTISVTGIPYVADSTWTGASFQMISVPSWSGMTFTPNVSNLQAAISGATLLIRKLHTAGAGIAGLTVAECADPIVFTVQGTYKAV